MKKKSKIIPLVLAVAVSCILPGCASSAASGDAVSVQSVEMITGIGTTSVYDSYAGLVVSQQTIEIQRDENKTVSEIYVEEGEAVDIGQKLFTYSVEDIQYSLEKKKLELEQLNNTISSSKTQKAQLENERKNVPSSQQLSYTIEIQSLEADIREAEYNAKLAQTEIDRLKSSMETPDVISEVAGVVQSLNPDGGSDPNTGEMLPFMEIVETGTYRIKGMLNELAANSLAVGTQVIVRSRVDDTQIWTGQISAIDWEKGVSGNSGYYDYSSDEMTSSTKYPFYIEMESTEGLMLGQHVYIEPNMGQDGEKSGLYLPSYYINDVNGDAWVWAANSKDRLEKRTLEIGEYDEELDQYEIKSGLTAEDFIAFPEESLEEGMSVTYYDESNFSGGNGASDISGENGEYYDMDADGGNADIDGEVG